MNLKQLLETQLGTIDDAVFGKAYYAYLLKHNETPPSDENLLEALEWMSDYILNVRDGK